MQNKKNDISEVIMGMRETLYSRVLKAHMDDERNAAVDKLVLPLNTSLSAAALLSLSPFRVSISLLRLAPLAPAASRRYGAIVVLREREDRALCRCQCCFSAQVFTRRSRFPPSLNRGVFGVQHP